MALSIDFTLTEAGIAAAFNAQSTGIDVALTHVAFGTGHKNPDGLETGLVTEVKRKPISGGSRVRPSQIRVAAVWAEQTDVADITEVGVFAGSVLFAYASSTAGTVIAKKVVGVDFVFYYDWVLSGIPADTISIVIDPDAAVALAALQIHIEDPLAHEQYLHRAAFAEDGAPFVWAGIAGGTPDTIELTLDAESVLTSYRAGQKFAFIAQGGNTGPVSLSVNGLAVHSVRKDGTDALAEGDIFASKVYEVTFDGLNFQIAGVTDFYNKLQTYSRSEVNSLLANKVNEIDVAAQPDAEAGTDNTKWMTPLRVFQAIAVKVIQATETVLGIAKVATTAQVTTGTDDATMVTPLKLSQRLTAVLIQATTTTFGMVKLSTQALAEAGADTLTAMTPQGVLWAINALTRLGGGSYAADTGTANGYTVAYTPAVAALTDGLILRFKANAANTGASTFSPNGLAAKSIVGLGQAALQGGEIIANGRCTVTYSLTLDKWILASGSGGSLQVASATQSQHAVNLGQAQSMFSPVVGSIRNGKMTLTAASATATFTADELIVETALGGQTFRLGSFSKTINLATTGAGGMDTGAAPVSSFVALYAIYNPTTQTAALLAVNAATLAPNIYGGANMPAGYTASALISVWPTNASSQLGIGFQSDRTIAVPAVSVLNTSATAGSLTPLSITSAVSLNAKFISGYLSVSSTALASFTFSLFPSSTVNGGAQTFTWGAVPAAAGQVNGFSSLQVVNPGAIGYVTVCSAGTPTLQININAYVI